MAFIISIIKDVLLNKEQLVTETSNFTFESLVLQNRLLNDAHSISDVKLPWFYHLFVFWPKLNKKQ